MSAQMTDCSLHGLGIVLTTPMQNGEQFLVKLIVAGKVRLLLYTVQNCAQSGRGSYRIGALFRGVATGEREDDLDEILDALTHA